MDVLSLIAAAVVRGGPEFLVGDPVQHANLLIFPVKRASTTSTQYATLDECLKNGTVIVTERGQQPPGGIIRNPRGGLQANQQQPDSGIPRQTQRGDSVNNLVLLNKSGKTLLLLAGELIIGGNQDRVIAKDMLVSATSGPIELDVFCVEKGRWANQTDKFGALGGVAHPELRKSAQHDNDQQRVWGEVAKNTESLKAPSSTARYQEVYRNKAVDATLKPYMDAFKNFPLKDISGVVVGYNGNFVWLDVFASPALFEKYWPKLLRSYIIGAAAVKDQPHIMLQLTTQMAQKFMDDRSGKTTYEGVENLYKLTRITTREWARYELEDTQKRAPFLVHISRMHL